MKNWKHCLLVSMFGLALLVAAAVLMIPVNAQNMEDGTIPERVYIASTDVGGLSSQEAIEKVQGYLDEVSNEKVTLAANDKAIEVSLADLGLFWNNKGIVEEAASLGRAGNLVARYKAVKDLEWNDKVYPILYAVDPEKVAAALGAQQAELETKAADAGLARENESFVITPGIQGVTLNIGESVHRIVEHFHSGWQAGDRIDLVADVSQPRGTEEELSKVKDVLGSFTTDFSGSAAGRVKNIDTGTGKINGHVLYPGDTLSVYELVAPFNAESGYALAGSFEGGTVVQSYGGGICQVSTTLYNAAIRAELEIVERAPHSMIVSYVDPSADAAIAGTVKDLKFKNSTDAPVYIEGYTTGKSLTFNVYGHKAHPEREVEFVSEVIAITQPGTQFKSSSAPIGSISREQGAHTGRTAVLWKIVKENGVEVSRTEFNRSNYMAYPMVYSVGTASPNSEAVSSIRAALATQNEATIRAAASAWQNVPATTVPKPAPEPEAPETPPERQQPEAPSAPAEGRQPEAPSTPPEGQQPEPPAPQPEAPAPGSEAPSAPPEGWEPEAPVEPE